MHTAKVGSIASYSTGHVGRERDCGRRKDKDKSEKDDESYCDDCHDECFGSILKLDSELFLG